MRDSNFPCWSHLVRGHIAGSGNGNRWSLDPLRNTIRHKEKWRTFMWDIRKGYNLRKISERHIKDRKNTQYYLYICPTINFFTRTTLFTLVVNEDMAPLVSLLNISHNELKTLTVPYIKFPSLWRSSVSFKNVFNYDYEEPGFNISATREADYTPNWKWR